MGICVGRCAVVPMVANGRADAVLPGVARQPYMCMWQHSALLHGYTGCMHIISITQAACISYPLQGRIPELPAPF
jgi:hypothetical protein